MRSPTLDKVSTLEIRKARGARREEYLIGFGAKIILLTGTQKMDKVPPPRLFFLTFPQEGHPQIARFNVWAGISGKK